VRRRPENPGVQRPRDQHVAGVLGLAGDLFERILAPRRLTDHGEGLHRLQRHFRDMPLDAFAIHTSFA